MAVGELEGVLLIDKPSGITSHDVVDRVRKILGMKRVGHAGTLDPAATGLMIILVGKATKLSSFLMGLDKVYEGTITLGASTTTQDAEGEIIDTKDVPDFTKEHLQAAMDEFMGDQYQVPPMFSAKKIDGVPLYKHARKGKVVEREPRFIRISKFNLDEWERPNLQFKVSCSKGTYVRTLANDLGEKLGTLGHISELRRTDIERFHIEDSVDLEELEQMDTTELKRWLIPSYQAVPSDHL